MTSPGDATPSLEEQAAHSLVETILDELEVPELLGNVLEGDRSPWVK